MTDRQTENSKQTEIYRHRERDRQRSTERETDRQTDRQTDRDISNQGHVDLSESGD